MRIVASYFYWLLIIQAILFSSCTTAYNGTTHRIAIRTNSTAKAVVVNGKNFFLENGEAFLNAERNKQPLIIGLKNGDSLQYVSIKSGNSFSYLFDAYWTAGISCLLVRDNPKRYYHQKNIYLEQKEGKIRVFRFPPVKKGTINLTLSMPYMNFFHVRTVSGRTNDIGFLGIGGGIDLFYKDNRYISLQASAAIDNEVPFPVGVDHFGKYEKTANVSLSARNNHIIRSFDIGYGFSFSRFGWFETDTTAVVKLKKNTNTLGISVATHYRITNNFKAGLLYQPGIFRLDNGLRADYQHLVSLELILVFRAKKG